MDREPDSRKRNPLARLYRERRVPVLIAAAVAALLLIAAIPTFFVASEQPFFCTTCHEMGPYYEAHATAAHKDVSCVDCHVDPGVVSHVTHKVVALKELYDHFTTKPTFPKGTAEVPNSRCVACHTSLPRTASGFDHALHTTKLTCAKCHDDAGHEVTNQALAAAGILDPKASTMLAAATAPQMATTVATASATEDVARTTGHVTTSCLGCHPEGSMQCSKCHTPKHRARGECSVCHAAGGTSKPFAFLHPTSTACQDCHTPKHANRGSCTGCHSPGATWAFKHPAGRPDCAQCHKPRRAHSLRTKCTACHSTTVRFVATSFAHRGSPECTTCHDAPARHRTSGCQRCHRDPSTAWAFTHPASRSCAECHAPPAGHFGPSCASCHSPGRAFKNARVSHAVISSGCGRCHARPSGHRKGDCVACHLNKGASWAFTHPSSTLCSRCHTPPANHFGGACASCHSRGRAFKNARVSHAVIAAGCGRCHTRPSGHRTGDCVSCHRNKGVSWSFSHPSSRSCSTCHRAPGGHYGSDCASCHRKPGVTWKGAHPKSGNCASCHTPPRGHYGSTCANCHHRPGVTWSGATFHHPSIPGGEHTYRTWACSQCHPSGPPAVNCTCHKNGNPGRD